MSEWVRLTPDGIEPVQWYKEAAVEGLHLIGTLSTHYPNSSSVLEDGILVCDAELDALARHAPAVKALLDAARRFVLYQPSPSIPDDTAAFVCTKAWAIRELATALAAFEEDDDE